MSASNLSYVSPLSAVPTPAYEYLVLLFIPLVTVFGNGLMILAVLLDKKLKGSVTNRYTAALAFADLLIGLIPMPFAVYVKVNGDHWDLGVALCRLYTAFDVAGSTASILHLVLISGDRYLAVMWPHEYQRYAKRAHVSFPIILVWLISATLTIPVVMGKSILNAESCWLENPEYMLYSSLLSFYIPASVLTLMYVKIFRKLNRHKGIRTMLRASGAVCGSDTGAPFHLPLVVVQEVSYAQPPGNNNNNDISSSDKNSATTSTSLLVPKGENRGKRDSRVSTNFDASQKSNSPTNAITGHGCVCSATGGSSTIQRSKTCPALAEQAQLLGRREEPDQNGQRAKFFLNNEMRKLTLDDKMPTKTDDDILDIDADDHTCLPLWTHLRKHETLRRHHLHEEVDEEDESQPGLLPGPAPPEQRPGFKRSVSTMARRPCVLATRRLSLWLAGRSSEELAVESPSSGTLAALDIARSKLTGAGARRYLDSLHASSSRTRLMSHQFDTNMWVDDPSINGQVLNSHVTLGLGKTPFDQTHTEVYALPIAMAARAGGTLRKLASRLTTALMRRTDKQAMAKEKKATKLVAMILGTCGTFRENRQKCFHLALLSYGVFIISWLPFFTFNTMRGLCLSIANSASECDWLPSELFFLTTWLGYANSGFNPIIYGLVNEHFRATYKRILRWPSKSGRNSWSV